MLKNEAKKGITVPAIKKILITQPRPDSDKSPYFELGKKYGVSLDFHPFIRLEGVSAKEFRKQKVDISLFSAVIFTSRNAIDHFFRICEELKVAVSQDTKYFCITEAVALYLQKFILYRKRKVFYGADGSNKSMFDVVNKHKENERFLYPVSENQQDNEIINWLKSHKCEYATPFMYRTIANDVEKVMVGHEYDIICFFTPSGVKSLMDKCPGYKQNGTRIGAFGN
ncbi:MAG TPA: uroporphyrinogen-III synthase, partial [Flavihumibacter sp.]|nr:uroporphyrinogen-III synthase [Flavihumibacter sp.]